MSSGDPFSHLISRRTDGSAVSKNSQWKACLQGESYFEEFINSFGLSTEKEIKDKKPSYVPGAGFNWVVGDCLMWVLTDRDKPISPTTYAFKILYKIIDAAYNKFPTLAKKDGFLESFSKDDSRNMYMSTSIYQNCHIFIENVFGPLKHLTAGSNPLMDADITHLIKSVEGPDYASLKLRTFLCALRISEIGYRGQTWSNCKKSDCISEPEWNMNDSDFNPDIPRKWIIKARDVKNKHASFSRSDIVFEVDSEEAKIFSQFRRTWELNVYSLTNEAKISDSDDENSKDLEDDTALFFPTSEALSMAMNRISLDGGYGKKFFSGHSRRSAILIQCIYIHMLRTTKNKKLLQEQNLSQVQYKAAAQNNWDHKRTGQTYMREGYISMLTKYRLQGKEYDKLTPAELHPGVEIFPQRRKKIFSKNYVTTERARDLLLEYISFYDTSYTEKERTNDKDTSMKDFRRKRQIELCERLGAIIFKIFCPSKTKTTTPSKTKTTTNKMMVEIQLSFFASSSSATIPPNNNNDDITDTTTKITTTTCTIASIAGDVDVDKTGVSSDENNDGAWLDNDDNHNTTTTPSQSSSTNGKPISLPEISVPSQALHKDNKSVFDYIRCPEGGNKKSYRNACGILIQMLLQGGYFSYFVGNHSFGSFPETVVQYMQQRITWTREPTDNKLTKLGQKRKNIRKTQEGDDNRRPSSRTRKFVERQYDQRLTPIMKSNTMHRHRCYKVLVQEGQVAIEIWPIGTALKSPEDKNISGRVVSASFNQSGKYYQVEWDNNSRYEQFTHQQITLMRVTPIVQHVCLASFYPIGRRVRRNGAKSVNCATISTNGYINEISWIDGNLKFPSYMVKFESPFEKNKLVRSEKILTDLFDIDIHGQWY